MSLPSSGLFPLASCPATRDSPEIGPHGSLDGLVQTDPDDAHAFDHHRYTTSGLSRTPSPLLPDVVRTSPDTGPSAESNSLTSCPSAFQELETPSLPAAAAPISLRYQRPILSTHPPRSATYLALREHDELSESRPDLGTGAAPHINHLSLDRVDHTKEWDTIDLDFPVDSDNQPEEKLQPSADWPSPINQSPHTQPLDTGVLRQTQAIPPGHISDGSMNRNGTARHTRTFGHRSNEISRFSFSSWKSSFGRTEDSLMHPVLQAQKLIRSNEMSSLEALRAAYNELKAEKDSQADCLEEVTTRNESLVNHVDEMAEQLVEQTTVIEELVTELANEKSRRQEAENNLQRTPLRRTLSSRIRQKSFLAGHRTLRRQISSSSAYSTLHTTNQQDSGFESDADSVTESVFSNIHLPLEEEQRRRYCRCGGRAGSRTSSPTSSPPQSAGSGGNDQVLGKVQEQEQGQEQPNEGGESVAWRLVRSTKRESDILKSRVAALEDAVDKSLALVRGLT